MVSDKENIKKFFDAWHGKYNASKYPRALYFDSVKVITEAQNPNILAAAIIDMLHWKDGKASIN
ncbi:MAG: hypothetical protein ABFD25_04535 [Clostridiaceae bacterium]